MMWSFHIMELLCASEYPYLFNLLVCYLKTVPTFFFSLPITMDDGYPYKDEMVIGFEDNLDLEKCFENEIALVELLIIDNKPPQSVIKEVLWAAWNTIRVVKVIKGKDNIYSMFIAEEGVARQLSMWALGSSNSTHSQWSTDLFTIR